MLLALLSVNRCQTLQALVLQNTVSSDLEYVFTVNKLLKHGGQNRSQAPTVFAAYTQSAELCVVQNLKVYIDRTKPLRAAHTQLLISFQNPYLPVSTDTIAGWLKIVLRAAGTSDDFSAHSTVQPLLLLLSVRACQLKL